MEKIICEVPVFPEGGPRIVLDPDAGTVTFVRCFRENRFWSLGAFRPEAVFPLSDIKNVRSVGGTLWVNTATGRAYIPERRLTNVEQLKAHLRRVAGGEEGPGVQTEVARDSIKFLVIPFVIAIVFIVVWIAVRG